MTVGFNIRSIRPDDYEHLLKLHVAAVMAIDPAYYPPHAQRSAIVGMTSERFRRAVYNGEVFDLACDPETNRPLAYMSVFGDEVMNLFVHPDQQGRGLGKALLSCAERRIALAGVERGHLRASLSAAPFYLQHGWRLMRIQHRPTRGRVIIEVALMEKFLG